MTLTAPIPLFAYDKPASCRDCVGFSWNRAGFMPAPEGPTANWNGVLLVGEALGEAEEREGGPFRGKAGLALTQMLQRGGLHRDHFIIDNCLRCRPPDNKLAKMPYEQAALASCRGYLDSTIARHRPRCIVALGDVALRRILGVSSLGKGDTLTKRRGFPAWSDRYSCWVIPTFHPSFLARGKRHLTGVFLDDIKKAVRIASEGFRPLQAELVVDPHPDTLERYVREFEARAREGGDDLSLAYDIETPYKADEEDEADLEFNDDPTYTILRVGFCYEDHRAVSFPWLPHYKPYAARLLRSRVRKLTWNGRYDTPRLVVNGMTIGGEEWDLMWAWHIAHSAQPKSLAHVASVRLPNVMRWKHLARTEAGRYNAFDALITKLLEAPIRKDITTSDLWPVFNRHILQLDVVLKEMSAKGVRIDMDWRRELSKDLLAKIDAVQADIERVVPREVRRSKVFVGKPKVTDGLVLESHLREVPVCSLCGKDKPTKPHFRVLKKKVNPCADGAVIKVTKPVDTYVRLLPFVPSNKQMVAYARFNGHEMVKAQRKAGDDPDVTKWTFNDDAIKTLVRRYPKDPLYPHVRDYREHETYAARYVGWWDAEKGEAIGGCEIGADNRMHTTFLHNPSTLRLSSQAPALQNWPHAGLNPLGNRIRGMVIADEGEVLLELDYKAIEAQLVGYEADSWRYLRLAKLGVHDFVNGHILFMDKKIGREDVPDIAWSDADLKACFKALKKRFPLERDVAKRIVHLSNYLGTPRKIYDLYPELFSSMKRSAHLQGFYFDLFPELRTWHGATIERADASACLKNAFGYLHYFFDVKKWFKHDGRWEWKPGEDAKAAIAFLPQSVAAAIIKDAMLVLRDKALVRFLRLQVHDSLVLGVPQAIHRDVLRWVKEIMEQPIGALPLAKFGMDGCLSIEVECKVGTRWNQMEEVAA